MLCVLKQLLEKINLFFENFFLLLNGLDISFYSKNIFYLKLKLIKAQKLNLFCLNQKEKSQDPWKYSKNTNNCTIVAA